MRIGFIGVGGIAGNYLSSLEKLSDVTIVAVCDVDRERAEAVAGRYGTRAYLDHRPMLDDEALDALFIAIPPFAHSDQEVLAAERGIPFFIAKPVAFCLEKARPVLDAVRRHRVLTNVGYMWRHSDLTDHARALIGGRPIGMVIGAVHVGTPGTPWWRVYCKSGGQIVEQSTHIYDLARYLVGEVVQVQGWGGTCLNPKIDFEDVSAVNLRFEDGAVGNITSTSLVRTGRYALQLLGADFHLIIDYGANRMTGHLGEETIEYHGTESGYALQVERFIRAVRDGETDLIRSDYEDGVRSLALTLAANEALHTGEIVNVPGID